MNTLNRAASYLLIAAVLTSGCASMKYGRQQEVEFDALPKGTTVRVQPGSDAPLTTPATVLLSRKHNYKAYFEKPGYEPQIVELKNKSSGAMWRNVAFIHPIIWIPGLIIDASTGAGREFESSKIFVTLTPLQPQQPKTRLDSSPPTHDPSFGAPAAPDRTE